MKFKDIYIKLLFPPFLILFILIVISAGALTLVFCRGNENSIIAYPVYFLSAYTLLVVCIACYKIIPRYYKMAKDKIYTNKYINRYFTDIFFKTHISLYISLGINLVYIVTNVAASIIYHTSWFAILSVYYAIMAIMRFLLIKYVNKNGLRKNIFGELKRSRLCAYILMIVNAVLTGVVLMIIYSNRGFKYHGFLIYVMAVYTFGVSISAVIDVFKYRKYNSPIMSATRVIRLAAAMFSVLSLETAMFSQFGAETSPENQCTMIMATGGGIALIVTVMSLYIIIHSTKEIKKFSITAIDNGRVSLK